MVAANYGYYYSLGTTDPAGLTNFPNVSTPSTLTTLTDNLDASDDGNLVVGDPVSWTATGGVTLYGVTGAGDPILYESAINSYYILVNDPNLQNTPIGFSSSSYTMCFAAGTEILTDLGTASVETLVPGDLVQTPDGREVAVKWIGRQVVNKMFAGERAQPVRIQSGALGNGLPESDLVVTADHGMVLNDLVINAGALVNGSTIDFVPMDDLALCETYYHVETDAHDVILANGAPSETYMDMPGRQGFANYQEYLEMYGSEVSVPEMARPRITSQRMLPESLRARLGISDASIRLTA